MRACLTYVCVCLMYDSAAHSVRSPPPCGEGLGVGVPVAETARANNNDPPPQPSPTRGEGGDRDWGSIDPNPAVQQFFLASAAKPGVAALGPPSGGGGA